MRSKKTQSLKNMSTFYDRKTLLSMTPNIFDGLYGVHRNLLQEQRYRTGKNRSVCCSGRKITGVSNYFNISVAHSSNEQPTEKTSRVWTLFTERLDAGKYPVKMQYLCHEGIGRVLSHRSFYSVKTFIREEIRALSDADEEETETLYAVSDTIH